MPLDTAALMAFDIPEVIEHYGPRDCALYALGCGLGQDPLDPEQLRYAGGNAVIEPFPTMPLVLGHPGFWLSDPRTGVDALRVVHGEQGLRIHAPLAPSGQVIGKTRVKGLIDKGEGRGVLLYSEKELRCVETGSLLAVTTITTFLRGDGGCGGTNIEPKPVHSMPDSPPDHVIETPTRPEQALLYRWNGDDNRLHLSPEVALAARYERPIMHGLCSLAMATRGMLATLCGNDPARLRGLDARFTAFVYPGETLRTEIWADGSFQTRVVERDVLAIGNGRCLFEGGAQA